MPVEGREGFRDVNTSLEKSGRYMSQAIHTLLLEVERGGEQAQPNKSRNLDSSRVINV
jgi:hypothetical protein